MAESVTEILNFHCVGWMRYINVPKYRFIIVRGGGEKILPFCGMSKY